MLNTVALMGRLTKDPELKYTRSNVPVASFTLAVERSHRSSDGQRQSDFIHIVSWGNTAAFVSKWFKKGQMAVVDGSIQARRYQDREGNSRTAFEVVAQNVHFADAGRPEPNQAEKGAETCIRE